MTALLLLQMLCSGVWAARVQGDGFSIEVPTGWETQRGVMNVPLMARPPNATDPVGWGQDLIAVTVAPADRRRTCLEGYTLRKLGELGYHASRFEKLDEQALDIPGKNGGVATLLTVRYTEGPREIMAYVMILDAGSAFITAAVTAPPARFELQRAQFRNVVESLRRASASRGRK